MNTKLLLIAVALVTLSSCSSVYKSGQTPDDVYYSPVRVTGAVVKTDSRTDDRYDEYSSYEDRQIRMGIGSPRYRYLDYDYYDMSYNPYRYGYSYGYYYNPFYCYYPVYNPVIITPSNPKVTTPRMANLAGYGNNSYNNGNIKVNPKTGYAYPSAPVRSYNNGNYNSSRLGNTLNKVFNNGGSNYNNSNNRTYNNSNSSSNRSYSPSNSSSNSSRSSSGSSSSGSSSSGSSTSRPVRNGKG